MFTGIVMTLAVCGEKLHRTRQGKEMLSGAYLIWKSNANVCFLLFQNTQCRRYEDCKDRQQWQVIFQKQLNYKYYGTKTIFFHNI